LVIWLNPERAKDGDVTVLVVFWQISPRLQSEQMPTEMQLSYSTDQVSQDVHSTDLPLTPDLFIPTWVFTMTSEATCGSTCRFRQVLHTQGWMHLVSDRATFEMKKYIFQ